MSEIQSIIDLLQDTETTLAHMQRAVEGNPHDEALRINAEAIAKRHTDLVHRLDYHLHVTQNEFCRYRIFRDWTDNYPAKGVAASLSAFQDLVTAVFDAVKSAPKQRFRPSPENLELSTFNFAGASAGSVIVTLAIPNDRLLAGETELDRTFSLVGRVLTASNSAELQSLAGEIGIASIAKAYAWAETSVNYGVDTRVDWGKTYGESKKLEVSKAAAENVRELIANKSEEKTDIIAVDCSLVGFDGGTSYFHIETLGEKVDIRGNLSPALSKSWTTGVPYRARVLKRTQIKYSTGEEDVKWTLLDLSPLALPSR